MIEKLRYQRPSGGAMPFLSLEIIVERYSCDFDGTSLGLHFIATKRPEKGGKMPLFTAKLPPNCHFLRGNLEVC